MIKAIIFDLDNCLAAGDAAGKDLLDPVFAAITQTNHGYLSEAQFETVAFELWRHPLNVVADKHRFPPEMRAAAWAANAKLEVSGSMPGYPDLHLLPELPALRFLVTSGFRRLQESKVRALGCASLFDGIWIDAIDEPEQKGKGRIFAEILERHAFRPAEVLVVGDNPDAEIEAGNRLGMVTAQILRPGVPRGNNARHVITHLAELEPIIRDAGRT
jgi:FMN phosphatase YigB (HAD superfamily)